MGMIKIKRCPECGNSNLKNMDDFSKWYRKCLDCGNGFFSNSHYTIKYSDKPFLNSFKIGSFVSPIEGKSFTHFCSCDECHYIDGDNLYKKGIVKSVDSIKKTYAIDFFKLRRNGERTKKIETTLTFLEDQLTVYTGTAK
jgi:hypothetical protein